MAFSPDGTTFASGTGNSRVDGTVQVWDIATWMLKANFSGVTRSVRSIAFSPDGSTIAGGGGDGTVQLWNMDTRQPIATFNGHTDDVLSLAFSSDGSTLASGSEDGTVLLWDLAPPTDTVPQIPTYDMNQDGIVNLVDLAAVGELFGKTGEGLLADINGDGVVNIFDLVTVSAHLDETAVPAAPVVRSRQQIGAVTPTTIQAWISMAHTADDGSLAFRHGIANLEALLATLIPDVTVLLANYPNPFNPETWIPYRLAKSTDVTLTIYDIRGALVRRFDLGYQRAGHYMSRARAVHWAGRNNSGESVASGVYFYQLHTDDYTSLRRMVILK